MLRLVRIQSERIDRIEQLLKLKHQ
jgi:hypothetical protein